MQMVKITNVDGVTFFEHEFHLKEVEMPDEITAYYHAYSFEAYHVTPDILQTILTISNETNKPIKMWLNNETGRLISCFEDHDQSEDSGWDVYEKMQHVEYTDYEMCSYYEWEKFGIPIDTSKPVETRSERTFAIGDIAIIL